MAISPIIKAESREGYRDQIANLVRERKEHSEYQFTNVRKRLPLLYDLYRGWTAGRFAPHKNNVHIPLIFSTIQSDVARKTQTSFGSWPIVSFVGNSPEDAIVARKREALVSSQMKDSESFRKGYDLFLTANLYGTAFAQYGWRHDEEDMMVQHADVLPVTGELVQIVEKRRVVKFDGPDWKVLDALDCFPQPGTPNIDEMDWFIVREYLDLDQIRALAKPNGQGRSIFDPNEVRRLESEGSLATQVGDDYKQFRQTARNEMDADAKLKEKFSRPIEIWTMWGRIPSELAPSDGIVNRVITLANGSYVLRNRPHPLWSGKIPQLAYSPTRDPHYLFAPGKAEVAMQLQLAANKFTNQQLDALDIFIDPIFLHNTDGLSDTENLFIRPGKWIGIQGSPQEMVQPLIPNLSGIQLGGQMTEVLWKWMQQGLGIVEDVVMGGAGQRQTAREFLGRSEAVATRLLLESRMFEETFLEPLADAFVDLNRQFLTTPREVFILGKRAEIDDVTGMRIPEQTRQMVDGWDLVPNYDARAVGATTRMGKAQRQQALTFMIQALGQNPLAASAANWLVLLRDLYKAFELDNVDEAINSPQEQERMMQMMNARPGQSTEVPGTPNQTGTEASIPNFVGQGIF